MAATGVVDGNLCDIAARGTIDPAMVPQGVNIEVGEADGYWCLNYK
jgi:hypothetical protein